MYIKYKDMKKDRILIININISQSSSIEVKENSLIVNMINKEDSLKFSFVDNTTAKYAQEKLFVTLGIKAPLSGVLDLTNLEAIEPSSYIGITMQDIAEKFNIDVRELSIVSSPIINKIKTEDIVEDVIEEGEE